MANPSVLRRPSRVWLLIVAVGFSSSLHAQTAPEVARNAFGAIVLIATEDAQGRPLALGSGFVVRQGLVVTNAHVVEGASKGYAKLVGQTATFPIEGAVAIDGVHDLVILKVAITARSAMTLAGASPEVGETVYAVGNPRGLEGTFSQGIVSGIRDITSNDRLIQITAPISPGSSGGPVSERKR